MLSNSRRVLVAGLCALLTSSAVAGTAVPVSGERRLAFNDGWRFFKGVADGAERPTFDDAKWQEVRLPHDWAIDGPFDSKLNPHTGALPVSGTGWYRKSFTLPASLKGRYFTIEFDGAMSNAKVWLNGQELGGRPYGYSGFAFDLTRALKFGGEANVLAVRATPEDRSSRWYPGAGMYRNVWLDYHRAGARRALGHICHHPAGLGGAGDSRCQGGNPQPRRRSGEDDGPIHRARPRRQAREQELTGMPRSPPAGR